MDLNIRMNRMNGIEFGSVINIDVSPQNLHDSKDISDTWMGIMQRSRRPCDRNISSSEGDEILGDQAFQIVKRENDKCKKLGI